MNEGDTVKVKVIGIKDGKLLVSGPTDEVRGSESLEDVFLELAEDK